MIPANFLAFRRSCARFFLESFRQLRPPRRSKTFQRRRWCLSRTKDRCRRNTSSEQDGTEWTPAIGRVGWIFYFQNQNRPPDACESIGLAPAHPSNLKARCRFQGGPIICRETIPRAGFEECHSSVESSTAKFTPASIWFITVRATRLKRISSWSRGGARARSGCISTERRDSRRTVT